MTRLPDRTVTRPDARGASRAADAQPWLCLVACGQRPGLAPSRHGLGGIARVSIGRGDAVDGVDGDALSLRVPDPWMSSAHATLERVVGSWILTDAGSKNGTLVNGEPTRRARLEDGDLVEAGSTFLVFRASLSAGDEPDPTIPLGERREDLGPLLHSTLARLGAATLRIDPSALRALLSYGWPGELNEFERCLEESVSRSRPGDTLTVEHLPAALRSTSSPATVPAPSRTEGPPVFVNEGDTWAITWGGAVARLRDGDGVRYLAYLVARPGVEVHAMELTSFARSPRGEAPPPGAGIEADEEGAGREGDAGPLVDAQAREAYRRRIESLRDVVEEATGWGDRERASKAQAELDALARELARAVGLGGRERKAGSAAERSRVTVTMRIRGTLKKLAEVHAALAEHLDATVRTGTFCGYTPRRA